MSSPLLNISLDTCVEEAEEIERKCNQLLEEILKSPEEYTTKNLEGYETELKEDLMKFLKRCDVTPTKIADYQYGFSTKLEANKRLIVIEKEDRTKCREYSAYRAYDQFCLQCRSLSNHKVLLYSRIIQGILFVPVKHVCAPKEYAAVMEVQEKMKEGDLKAALSLQRRYAVKKHPRFLFPKEKPRKRSKASTTSESGKPSEAAQDKDTVDVTAAGAAKLGFNDIDLSCCESLKDDVSDVVDSPMSSQLLYDTKNADTSLSPDVAGKLDVLFQSDQPKDVNNNASTSDVKPFCALEMIGGAEDTVNDYRSDSKQEAPSPSDSQAVLSLNHPSQASSTIDARRGHKGRKRGSKNLLFAKNSLDLIDAIKSLLPPSDDNSAPKKRRRRRKENIQASSSEATKSDDDENLGFIASTNVTATILDMIDTELLNSQKYMSENYTTSDAENTDDCEIVEDNLYLPVQHEDHHGQYIRTRSETITIED